MPADDVPADDVPADFQPGLRLAAAFHAEVVRPLLATTHPGLSYAAALIGPGSEVLGRDTARSTDHDWGPRLQLFLRPEDDRLEHDRLEDDRPEDDRPVDDARLGPAIDELLRRELPPSFGGFPVRFPLSRDAPVRHRVTITNPDSWYQQRLGFLPHARIELLDWLATPSQLLLEETAGAVFHDEPGVLGAGRAALAWYPEPVWRYLLAAQWQRISQEESFVGRCAEVGDEVGAALITARLVRDLGRLHLLMARRYPPYAKWFGSAVADLPGAGEPLLEALHSTGPVREAALCRAYEYAAARHNELGLTAPVDGATRWFFDRPFRVLMADRFVAALVATQTEPALRTAPPLGAIDQFADSTDLFGATATRRAVVAAALHLPADG